MRKTNKDRVIGNSALVVLLTLFPETYCYPDPAANFPVFSELNVYFGRRSALGRRNLIANKCTGRTRFGRNNLYFFAA